MHRAEATNMALERSAGSHSLAAAAHCQRSADAFSRALLASSRGGPSMDVMRVIAVVALTLGILTAPLPSEAQQPGAKIARIGVLQPGTPPEPLFEAFREGLRDLGYREGRNLILEVRWAEGNADRLTELAAELVALKVDVIETMSTPAALAARRATSTIPIVFTGVGDPVGSKVVPSLARPDGNTTGVSTLATELSAKRLELLREILPRLSRLAMLFNDRNPSMVLRAREAEMAAAKLGVTIQSLGVHNLTDVEAAFRAIEAERAAALLTLVDPFTRQHRKRIVDFAAQRRLPAIYESREFVDSGGLICYGPNLSALQRRAAIYVDKILKGTKPADLPVEQPTTFEVVINLGTAKALGLTVPPAILLRANQVIE